MSANASALQRSFWLFKDCARFSLSPLARAVTRSRPRVLVYHRFSTTPVSRRLTADAFERQVQFIARHFTPMKLGELVERLVAGEELPPLATAVTIDDGYADFVHVAAPILRKYRVPATLYVVSNFVDRQQWLWYDALHYLVHAAASGRYAISDDTAAAVIELDDAGSRQRAWESIADSWLYLAPEGHQDRLAHLARTLGVPLPESATQDYAAATWQELQTLEPELFEIGGHTRSHPILSLCDVPVLRDEIAGCKSHIEDMLQREVVSFCYPNGLPRDYSSSVVAEVQAAGYRNAVVAHGGMITSSIDPFLVPRLGAPFETAYFRAEMSGVSALKKLIGRAR